jgi:hypothetical protein
MYPSFSGTDAAAIEEDAKIMANIIRLSKHLFITISPRF